MWKVRRDFRGSFDLTDLRGRKKIFEWNALGLRPFASQRQEWIDLRGRKKNIEWDALGLRPFASQRQ